MKIIDLLNKIANEEEVPDYVKYYDMFHNKVATMMVCKENIFYKLDQLEIQLNSRVEPIEEKKIPLIPDDELYVFKGDSRELNYNFKVLKEKINQILEVINNEYNK